MKEKIDNTNVETTDKKLIISDVSNTAFIILLENLKIDVNFSTCVEPRIQHAYNDGINQGIERAINLFKKHYC